MDAGGLRRRFPLPKRLALSLCLTLTSSIVPSGSSGFSIQLGARAAGADSQLVAPNSLKQKTTPYKPTTLARLRSDPRSVTGPAQNLTPGMRVGN